MCGIVGYIGEQDATPIILSGLKRLEYRGYDSAGLAVLQDGTVEIRRDAGKLENLVTAMVARTAVVWTGRDRTYTLGYAWRTQSAKCTSSSGRYEKSGGGSQRDCGKFS